MEIAAGPPTGWLKQEEDMMPLVPIPRIHHSKFITCQS